MKLFDERVNSVAKYQYACIRMASSALWAFEDLHEKLKRLDFGRLSLISFNHIFHNRILSSYYKRMYTLDSSQNSISHLENKPFNQYRNQDCLFFKFQVKQSISFLWASMFL